MSNVGGETEHEGDLFVDSMYSLWTESVLIKCPEGAYCGGPDSLNGVALQDVMAHQGTECGGLVG